MKPMIFVTGLPSFSLIGAAAATALDTRQGQHASEFMHLADNYPIIMVSQSLVDELTSEEYDAIIAHEMGHIECGHLSQMASETSVSFNGTVIVDSERMELEADAYASKTISPVVLKDALSKTIRLMFTLPAMDELVMSQYGTKISDEMREVAINKCIGMIKYRYDALDAMVLVSARKNKGVVTNVFKIFFALKQAISRILQNRTNATKTI